MKTLIVSAFPACGKSFYHNKGDKYDNHFSTLDSDSSKFSWVLGENGKPTGVRNPDFPDNYIDHIKRNIGNVSFIFVSSHDEVRQALEDNSLPYVTVMPYPNLRDEWIDRCISRGNPQGFISLIDKMWGDWTSFESQRNWKPKNRVFLSKGEYLSTHLFLLDTYRDWYGVEKQDEK